MMRPNHVRWGVWLSSLMLAVCSHAAMTPDELKLQDDFKKMYATPNVAGRREALALLLNQANPAFWRTLGTISTTDPEVNVRLEAFRVLAKEPARDNTIGALLAAAFSANKSNNRNQYGEKELAFAKAMEDSEFKTDVLNTLIDFGSMMIYQEFVTYDAKQSGPSAAAVEDIRRQQRLFAKYLGILNHIAGTSFTPSHKTHMELKKWWAENMATYALQDRKLMEKYKAGASK